LFANTRGRLQCWLSHDADVLADLTLAQIGERLDVTRERVRQILSALGHGRRRGHRVIEMPDISIRIKTYSTDIPAERREAWRVYQRERYRNDPGVRAAAKRRYDERWANDPTFREAHRRRARERYWRLKMQHQVRAEEAHAD
jgi:hypothetical protein